MRDAPRWRLEVFGDVLELGCVFGPDAAVVLDIGFGGGEGLVAMAKDRPHECFIGVEVHTPGVASVIAAIEDGQWQHVRVVEGDVLDFLPRLGFGTLAAVRIWFPDPWQKQRQQHRRLVRPQVIMALTDRLRVGGTLHIASDIVDYVRHTQRVVAEDGRLGGGMVERPEWRPVTRFEQRGRNEGRAATDLIYERIS